MITHKDEFDLVMEFAAPEHLDRFRLIIDAFAKREFASEQTVLYDSWYQPLLRLEVPLEGYKRITDVVLRDREQIAHIYALEEEAAAKVDWFKEEFPELETSAVSIWVNDAFFRYLTGGSD